MTRAPQWDQLTIRRFRGLASLGLDGLGKFNLLLGANDVGKTSVLESIFLLSGFANTFLPVKIQRFRNYAVNDIDDLSPLFHGLANDQQVELIARSSSPPERRTLAISAPYEQVVIDRDRKRAGNGDRRHSSSSIPPRSRLLRYDATIQRGTDQSRQEFSGTLVDQGDSFLPTVTPDSALADIIPARFVYADVQYDGTIIADAIVNKKAETLLRYLRIINPRVTDIATDANAAYLDIGLEKMLPLNMFGSGMIRAAFIISLCIAANQRMLLIDEIENGLHYKAIPPLLKALLALSREQNVQIFATTHSLEILKGLQQVLAESACVEYRATTNCYALQRDSQELVRSYRYSYREYAHALKHGIEVR